MRQKLLVYVYTVCIHIQQCKNSCLTYKFRNIHLSFQFDDNNKCVTDHPRNKHVNA